MVASPHDSLMVVVSNSSNCSFSNGFVAVMKIVPCFNRFAQMDNLPNAKTMTTLIREEPVEFTH